MTYLSRGPTLALALVLSSCTANATVSTGPGSEPENTTPAVDALEIAGHPGLEACASGTSGADLDASLQIARDFRESCHEMVVCGGLNASFAFALVQLLVNAAAGGETRPNGFTYEGEGFWRASDVMTVRLHLPFDTTFGRAGDPITFDVFDVENYFAGATIVASASIDLTGTARTSLAIEFTGTGPGAELLGLGAMEAGSIELDADEIAATIGRLEVRNDIVVLDEHGDTTVTYTLRGSPTPLSELANDGAQGMELVDVQAENPVTGQRIEILDWGMEYRAGVARTLDGTIEFEVAGGVVPYRALFAYPHRSSPDVTLGCR